MHFIYVPILGIYEAGHGATHPSFSYIYPYASTFWIYQRNLLRLDLTDLPLTLLFCLQRSCRCAKIVKSREPYFPCHSKQHGALAQLGERKVRNLEVRGSIPLCSTMYGTLKFQRSFVFFGMDFQIGYCILVTVLVTLFVFYAISCDFLVTLPPLSAAEMVDGSGSPSRLP